MIGPSVNAAEGPLLALSRLGSWSGVCPLCTGTRSLRTFLAITFLTSLAVRERPAIRWTILGEPSEIRNLGLERR